MIDDEFPELHMDKPVKGFYFAEGGTNWCEDRIKELTDLLREIQFCDKNYFDHSDCCPVCGGDEEDGHKDDCKLNKLLNNK